MSERGSPTGTPNDRPEASRELTSREQELAAIYERLAGIVFYIRIEADGEFCFLSMSPAGLEAIGLAREQLVGSLRDIIPPASRDLAFARDLQ